MQNIRRIYLISVCFHSGKKHSNEQIELSLTNALEAIAMDRMYFKYQKRERDKQHNYQGTRVCENETRILRGRKVLIKGHCHKGWDVLCEHIVNVIIHFYESCLQNEHWSCDLSESIDYFFILLKHYFLLSVLVLTCSLTLYSIDLQVVVTHYVIVSEWLYRYV